MIPEVTITPNQNMLEKAVNEIEAYKDAKLYAITANLARQRSTNTRTGTGIKPEDGLNKEGVTLYTIENTQRWYYGQ